MITKSFFGHGIKEVGTAFTQQPLMTTASILMSDNVADNVNAIIKIHTLNIGNAHNAHNGCLKVQINPMNSCSGRRTPYIVLETNEV